jgi:hypothetical protein
MISLAVALQAIEIFLLRNRIQIWPTKIPQPIFLSLVILQILAAVAYGFLPHFIFLIFMLTGTVVIAWRFRGTFNGGSDYMTVTVLIGLLLPKPLGYWYIVVQLILSYMIAGLVKLKNREWRNGQALRELLTRSNYIVPKSIQSLVMQKKVSLLLSWALIIFECSFFLSLVSQSFFWVYAVTAMVFHLGNFWVFGLNRFVLAWAAAYPSLYWAVKFLN